MAENTGIISGGDIMVYVNTGTEAVPVWTPTAHATEHKISHSTELRTRKTKDTGKSSQKKAGEQSTTINISALATYGTHNYFDLRTLQLAGAEVMLKYSGRLAADVTAGKAEVSEQIGDKYEQGKFLITSLERTDPTDADSTMSATFENSGLPEIKTVAI
jgi:hypothetical protein